MGLFKKGSGEYLAYGGFRVTQVAMSMTLTRNTGSQGCPGYGHLAQNAVEQNLHACLKENGATRESLTWKAFFSKNLGSSVVKKKDIFHPISGKATPIYKQ